MALDAATQLHLGSALFTIVVVFMAIFVTGMILTWER